MILRLVLWPVRQVSSLLFPPGELDGLSPAVAAKAATAFVQYLKSVAPAGIDVHAAWTAQGFVATKEQATESGSLILLYLHSPLHRAAAWYGRQVLCHPAVVDQILTQPCVLGLGLSIHSGQGAQLAQMLQVQAYPALLLLQPPPARDTASTRSSSSASTTMTLLFRAEGNALLSMTVADQLVPRLQTAVQRHQTILAEQEARRVEREQEALLRQEQDAEYQAALRADQERERQLAAEAAEAERAARLEQERLQAEQQAAAAVVDSARQVLRDAPASGGALIRFVLPSGQKLNRRFYADDTIQACKAFVRLHYHENELEMGTIGLSTNFPKKSYNNDADLTLQEAGLTPQAVLMVQDLDA